MANIVVLPIVYVDGNVLTASDLNSNFVTLNSAVVPVTNGGLGLSSAVTAGVLYGVSATVAAYTSAGSATTVLHGSATVPAFSAVVEADITLADNTTNNVSTTKHGFTPKLPNDVAKYLNGTGAYSIPPAAGATAKASASVSAAGALEEGFNTTTARTGAGAYTATWGTDFANTTYIPVIQPIDTADRFVAKIVRNVGTMTYVIEDAGGTAQDTAHVIVAFGTQ
jgi:hypothetical protein